MHGRDGHATNEPVPCSGLTGLCARSARITTCVGRGEFIDPDTRTGVRQMRLTKRDMTNTTTGGTALFEALEGRRMMSASVSNGVLWVNGTAGNDKLEVDQSGSDVYVFENGLLSRIFPVGSFQRLSVSGGEGDDHIKVFNGVTAPAFLYGNGGSDAMIGTARADYMTGGSGNDFLTALDGNDSVYGDGGNDSVFGGNGTDLVVGGGDNDFLYGDAGNDQCWGGTGNDYVTAGAGDDYVQLESGNDTCWAGDGNDSIWGGDGGDTIQSQGGADKVRGD